MIYRIWGLMVAQADSVTRDELARALDRIDERFDRVDERFDRVDERFDRVDERFAQVDERFAQVDERFAQVDERFDQVDERFDRVDRRSILQGQMIVELQENLKLLQAGQQRVEYKVDAILKHFNIEANEG
ncbi:MAG: hypothetical protein OXE52_02535 [Chloroflexi bacterium]|nr:hypothetical protein [Chloroflexota bacterium]